MMKIAMISENAIEDYFQNNNNFMKDELRNRFNTFYNEAMALIPNAEESPDEVFLYIYSKALPEKATKAHCDAVMTLMAYFFECCDIFKSPEA